MKTLILTRNILAGALAALWVVSLTGCNTTVIEKKPDGTVKGANSRWFWSSEQYEWSMTPEGFTAKATKSNPDAQSLEAVARGVSEGAVKGAK